MLPWFIPPTSIISNTSLSYNSFISYSFSWWEKRQLGLHTHWLNIFVPSYLTFFFCCNYSLCRAVWEACSLSFWINKSWIWKEKKKNLTVIEMVYLDRIFLVEIWKSDYSCTATQFCEAVTSYRNNGTSIQHVHTSKQKKHTCQHNLINHRSQLNSGSTDFPYSKNQSPRSL